MILLFTKEQWKQHQKEMQDLIARRWFSNSEIDSCFDGYSGRREGIKCYIQYFYMGRQKK